MGTIRYKSIAEIKEHLENAKSRSSGCALLIGAGCSVKAGIPTAAGFVEAIRKNYKLAYESAKEKTYSSCMAELLVAERRDLIGRQYVDKAQINWAHLCIALLMQHGYVDRVLTTNFDLLVVRASATLGIFPAVYDFATSQLLKTAEIPEKAVFYLHGQRTGFVLMNTKDEMDRHSKLLGPVFDAVGSGRVWIVAGYSGDNDPVFNHLAKMKRFDSGLFWIGHGDTEPGQHVREKLLEQDKDAFFTKGFDADSFFIALTRALQIFPPDLFSRPFTYLKKTLTYITPFVDAGRSPGDDVMQTPSNWIDRAVEQFEKPAWELIEGTSSTRPAEPRHHDLIMVAAQDLFMKEQYEKVLQFHKNYTESPSPELAGVLSMAYVLHGNKLLDQAKAADGARAKGLFNKAKLHYERALAINPDRHEALHNWGNLLLDMAKSTSGTEATQLFTEADSKFQDAFTIKSDEPKILVAWGNLKLEQAKREVGREAQRLFDQAGGKYEAALRINPNMPDVLHAWGNLLLDKAKTSSGAGATSLFAAAEDKYRAALAIKRDMPEAFCQWGNVLLDRAKLSSGEEADRLFASAADKYRAALDLKPDMHEVLNNWGNLLLDHGQTKRGLAADELFEKAKEMYESALAIKPDDSETLNNLGYLFMVWRRAKAGNDADEAFDRAKLNFEAALTINPDMHVALSNWGNLLLDHAKTKPGEAADRLFAEAERKFRAALVINPGRYDVFEGWGSALAGRASKSTGDTAIGSFAEAAAKYTSALDIWPMAPNVLQKFGELLEHWQNATLGKEPDPLLVEAKRKYNAASTSNI